MSFRLDGGYRLYNPKIRSSFTCVHLTDIFVSTVLSVFLDYVLEDQDVWRNKPLV